jgi:hypothetical protein
MLDTTSTKPAIHWENVSTVISAAILIGAEVFGAAFAGGWAVANLLGWGVTGEYIFTGLFFLGGVVVMVAFVRNGMRIEPFVTRR